ncbi:12865_t:CDS:1, partial [Acaulospora morrowiae]
FYERRTWNDRCGSQASETNETNANAQRRHRAEKTEEQCNSRRKRDATAHHQCRLKSRFLNLVYNFSENTNNDNYSILHKIHSNNYSHCSYCNVLKFPNKSPGMCCRNGKVILAERHIPPSLQRLFYEQDDISKHFHDNIRIYNFAFVFASIGICFDHKLANARAEVYTFCVQDSFYHCIESLLPNLNSEPHYLQIYIWDTKHELHHQMNAIPNSQLNHAIVHELKTMLNKLNPYVSHLRYILELPKKNIANL